MFSARSTTNRIGLAIQSVQWNSKLKAIKKLKMWLFRWGLKVAVRVIVWRHWGREFKMIGPETQNALSPNLVLVLGTMKSVVSAERPSQPIYAGPVLATWWQMWQWQPTPTVLRAVIGPVSATIGSSVSFRYSVRQSCMAYNELFHLRIYHIVICREKCTKRSY